MTETATFAGGCFWCTEAIFNSLKGVSSVMVGYAGGEAPSPSYEKVSQGTTGHAETIQITFDPKTVSYKDLLYVFFRTHDPTTVDKQGPDSGPQYRSMVFYHGAEQKRTAEEALLEAQKNYSDKIVTEIAPFKDFYPGEDYHQDFYKKNPNQTYCRLVIDPKIEKLKKDFKVYLK
jgi:peptide-methionine (S)-S-oxide reductase